MLPSIRHNCGTVRVEAEIVAASSNHSDGRAEPAALTTMANNATLTGSSGRSAGADRAISIVARAGRREMLTRLRLTHSSVAKR